MFSALSMCNVRIYFTNNVLASLDTPMRSAMHSKIAKCLLKKTKTTAPPLGIQVQGKMSHES